ncbi:hypothetical protein D9613_006503 [Agrocybe pediades]|uniref:Carboxylic ester hydrolase n=1 Tax=Agrocybe pediades TaxID=84607 RepID=A0A8H4VIL5_9AGAR|nr:hypothetical protein D9613_006503 [Agrocybe pediades]
MLVAEVAMSAAYGFIAGKEVLEDGVSNIAIYDQREALKWVNRYIHAFGGDSSRVTINGGSAGGVSVVYQMLAFGGNNDGLFAAAFAQSGSFLSSSPTSRGQVYYDKLVKDADCEDSSDTLGCLRNVPLDTLRGAVDKSPDIFSYRGGAIIWTPHVDGSILQDSPFNLVRDGKISKVPLVIGNMDDEGTNFALQYTNHTSDGHFEDWVHKYWFPDAPRSSLGRLFELYPSTPAEGSPFGTGDSNQLYPQFKRTAAFAGDAIFQSPRRYLVRKLAKKGEQKLWCYASTKLKDTPIMGSFHGSDYATGFLDDPLIYFVNYHDPNVPADSALTGGMLAWPEYSGAEGSLGVYTFNDEGDPVLTTDTFREEAIEELTRLSQEYPIF